MKPFPHQVEDFERCRDLPYFAFWWEQGLGKSKMALDWARYLTQKHNLDGILVIARNDLPLNWAGEEVPKHWEYDHAFAWHEMNPGTKKHERRAKEELDKSFWFTCMTPDAMMTTRGYKFLRKIVDAKPKQRWMLVVDEATSFKTPGAKRTKRMIALAQHAAVKTCLTGTNVVESPFDAYSQMRILDPDFWKQFGIPNYTTFTTYFGIYRTGHNSKTGRDYKELVNYRNLDQLREWLAPYVSIRKKDEELDLPPKLYSKHRFQLTPQQRKAYEEMERYAITFLDDGEMVTAEIVIKQMLRLQQITCNYLPPDDDADGTLVPLGPVNPRLDALASICEELPHKAIIWARFRQDIDQICALLKDKAVRYDGAVPSRERMKAKERFQNGDAQFFVGNPAAAGMGLTLHAARTVIYYSNSFSLEQRLQSEDRAHRIGQEHPVHYIDIVAPSTVDTYIVSRLRNKLNISAEVTGKSPKEWI